MSTVTQVQLPTVALRGVLPDLILRPGMMLAARVAERAGQHGILMIAGQPLVAELPAHLRAGQSLRLTVREASEERIVLKIADPAQAGESQQLSMSVPEEHFSRVRVEEGEGRPARGDSELEAISIVYESPALGSIEFRLWIAGEAVSAGVRVRAGGAFALAEQEASGLRAALEASTGRAASVTVAPRNEPLNVYA